MFEQKDIIWSDYFKYRVQLRGYDISKIEKILRYSDERYYDTETFRWVAIGMHDKRLVMIPYEAADNTLIPVTIHAVTRQQIKFRIKIGRLMYEKI
ncbi:MAG: hypothetical protein HQK77_19680 [Desulfobacterales bacterium]|nr:hypothetical protein [Desulfobacterales bacterium]